MHQNMARYETKKFATGSSLTFTKKFVASIKAVQNTLFFFPEILRIEIVLTSPGCPNEAPSRVIDYDINLI